MRAAEGDAVISQKLDLRGFGFTNRTFWVSVSDLRVRRDWQREHLDLLEEDAARARKDIAATAIHGIARLNLDDVCVIGRKDCVREFPISLQNDRHAAERWNWTKANDLALDPIPGDDPFNRLRQRIVEQLDEKPPTAILFTMDGDREVGSEGGWFIECMIPDKVLKQIETEFLQRRMETVDLGIHWIAGLVHDEHAHPAYPTTWGLIDRGYRNLGPYPLRGHVESVSWQVARE